MPYTREQLESMPRSQLQSICKGYGFKANESTAKIIDNILTKDADAVEYSRRVTRRTSNQKPEPELTQRKATKGPLIARPNEENRRVTRSDDAHAKGTRRTSARLNPLLEPSTTSSAATSIRKSKLSQTSLGVGRPKAAGGTGARPSSNKGSATRLRSRKLQTPLRHVIEESGPEIGKAITDEVGNATLHPTGAGSGVTRLPPTPAATPEQYDQSPSTSDSSSTSKASAIPPSRKDFNPVVRLQEDVAALSATFTKAIKEQSAIILSLQADIRLLKTSMSHIPGLKNDFVRILQESVSHPNLPQDIQELKKEFRDLRQELISMIQGWESYQVGSKVVHKQNIFPAEPSQVLGKHPRSAYSSMLEEADESCNNMDEFLVAADNVAGDTRSPDRTHQPRKRQKVSHDHEVTRSSVSPIAVGSSQQGLENAKHPSTFDFSSFFNFGDNQNFSSQHAGGDANGMVRQTDYPFPSQPFSTLPFPLVADHDNTIVPNLGRVQSSTIGPIRRQVSRRASPTKRANSSLFVAGNQQTATLQHQPATPTPPSVGINPAQLLATDILSVERTPVAARTLFGTELDGDTRFGEFGIEGVASEFWKAPGFL